MAWKIREIVALIFLAAAIPPAVFITYFEGDVFPVVARLQIDEISETDAVTRVSGNAPRLRESCDWYETRWWLGRPGQDSKPLKVNFTVRPKGEARWTGIFIGADARSIINNSYAEAVYHCWPWPFDQFETTTLFYLGNGHDAELLK